MRVIERIRGILKSPSRGARTFRTAITALLGRGGGILATLISVPMTLHALGAEAYGVWTTALGVAAVLANADGGVSNSLLSPFADAASRRDTPTVRRLLAAGLLVSVGVAAPAVIVACSLAFLVDWSWFFVSSTPNAARDFAAVLAILGACYVASFPPSVVRTLRLGLLDGPRVNAWDSFSVALVLVSLYAALQLSPGLLAVALAWGAPPVLARLASAIAFLSREGRVYIPERADFDIAGARRVLTTGAAFLAAVLAQLTHQISDQLMIGRLLGAGAIADYAVPLRLFAQAQVLITLVLAAQWPSYAHAIGQGDHAWVSRHLKMTLLGAAALSIVVCGAMALCIEPIMRVWLNATLKPDPTLVAVLAAMGVVSALGNVLIYFNYAVGKFRRVVASYVGALAIALPLMAALIPRMGVTGAAVGQTVALALAVLAPGLILIPSLLRELANTSPDPGSPDPGA